MQRWSLRVSRLACALALGVACTTVAVVSGAQESAVADAQARAKGAPASAPASLAYGRALRKAGRDGEAMAELRRGLAVAGGRADDAISLAWEIARTHIARRDFQSALAECQSIGKIAPTPAAAAASHACAAEAHLLWRRGTEATAELAEVAKSAAAAKPSLDVLYASKVAEGRIHELESKDDAAAASYADAIALAPDRLDAHVYLGVMQNRVGKDGLPELRKAVSLDPRDPVAEYELGRALPRGSADAVAALEKATAERPTYVDALRSLAEAYVADKRLPDAKATADKVMKLAPTDVESHVIAGRVLLADGKVDEARKAGEQAAKLMPNSAAARLLIADAWAKKGEIDYAIEAYQAAFGLDHTDPTPLVNAAEACVAAGRPTSAKAFARRATQDFASYGPAWVALGDALAADKDPTQARTAYESAKKSKDIDAKAIDEKLSHLK